MNKKYEEILINLVKLKAADFYGKNIPEPVQKRLDNELNYITEHKLSTKYMFAYETPVHLQKYIILSTLCDYTLVSFLLGLTEIDPLPPHYHCSCCGYIEFPFGHITEKTVWDLPSKPCPDCLENLHKYGYSVKLPNNANRNIICEYASSAEKQEILEFAKKFYNGYTLVYGIRNDKETHNKKTEENVKYKKNIVYIIPNEDIKYHNLSKIYFDLPV
ncbi:MAG: hypothetical protein IJ736_09240, partial [Firmicutes bacterium]|nr:hypothetical protein [Bacillota bacterium]